MNIIDIFKNIGKEKTNIYKEKKSKLQIDNPKKVSVVIPNYNYEKYIIERIDSILFQTYPIYELIIIDDCSKDNSVKVISKKIEKIKKDYPNLNVKFLINEKNSGNVFCGWQRAFEESNGDYLWIAEADDSCANNFLETIMKGFDNPDTVLSYCESLTTDENNVILMKDLREWIDIFKIGKWDNDYILTGKEELSSTLCINNTIANASSVVFKKYNGLDYKTWLKEAQTFRLAGDWHFYSKVVEAGKVAYFKDSLNYHRMQSKSITLTTPGQKEYNEICKIQDEIMTRVELTDEIKEKVYQRRKDTKERLHAQ